MTRGKRVNPEFLEAASVEDAIAKLQALKRERAQLEASQSGDVQPGSVQPGSAQVEEGEPVAAPAKKRGRPAKVRAAELPQPETSSPGNGGRAPKKAAPIQAAQTGFGVSKPTAHRPLGLLEVQESADLDALMADPRLAGQIAMRLDERFALVLPASLERLQAALLKAGHTPKLVGPKSSGPGGP
ncbi:hypothetical protein [Deinococcus altitudinis]|uniref:hypothetical protein n=1 Tax=Deinococcus altitudinis TaxID=468914 RepID=UPI003892A548